ISDNTYGEQLRFKSPSGKIELYSATLEELLPGYSRRISDNTYGEQLRFKSPSGKIELYSATLEELLPG
ncbi:thiosulfate reductase PhsA, partial [Salmonella enterica subsp. enterica serovar Paratyphi A]|nr:thiosulfate reductase PhsA [Salmonella enterica subsp. enterica serovar Paratyphi A]